MHVMEISKYCPVSDKSGWKIVNTVPVLFDMGTLNFKSSLKMKSSLTLFTDNTVFGTLLSEVDAM